MFPKTQKATHRSCGWLVVIVHLPPAFSETFINKTVKAYSTGCLGQGMVILFILSHCFECAKFLLLLTNKNGHSELIQVAIILRVSPNVVCGGLKRTAQKKLIISFREESPGGLSYSQDVTYHRAVLLKASLFQEPEYRRSHPF